MHYCNYGTSCLSLQLFKIAYCDYFDPSKAAECNDICKSFVETSSQCMPEMLKKQKVHLLLHLVECMAQFGPTSAFNSERYILSAHYF